MQVRKLVIPRKIESLNVLLGMHRFRRAKYVKGWHQAVASAPLSYPTVPPSLIGTISAAVQSQYVMLSDIAAT